MTTRLDRSQFAAPPTSLAQSLLGCTLVRIDDDGARLAGRIVETEAYCGPDDQAAHSRNGHRSPRNEVMFGKPGLLYVYFTYGMHHCMNVVCGALDEPVAVLIRALEPTEGLARMFERREGTSTGRRARRHALREQDLCSGPARLCRALGIERAHNGADLTTDERFWIEPGTGPVGAVVNTARIGVDSAGEWAGKPLRWFMRDSAHVSRRSAPLSPRTRRGP